MSIGSLPVRLLLPSVMLPTASLTDEAATVLKLVRSRCIKGITLPGGEVRILPTSLDAYLSGPAPSEASPLPDAQRSLPITAGGRRQTLALYEPRAEIRRVKARGGLNLYRREDLDAWLAGMRKAG